MNEKRRKKKNLTKNKLNHRVFGWKLNARQFHRKKTKHRNFNVGLGPKTKFGMLSILWMNVKSPNCFHWTRHELASISFHFDPFLSISFRTKSDFGMSWFFIRQKKLRKAKHRGKKNVSYPKSTHIDDNLHVLHSEKSQKFVSHVVFNFIMPMNIFDTPKYFSASSSSSSSSFFIRWCFWFRFYIFVN